MITLLTTTTTTNPPTMRVLRLWPNTDWTTIWKNLHEERVPEKSKVTWHGDIHGIMPTHDRLHKILMVLTDLCRLCNKTDTLLHRLTECGEGPTMWEWTRWRLAIILRTDPKYRVIHNSLWDFRTRLRNNQDRHGRKEHINR